jgi:hypothetical protein
MQRLQLPPIDIAVPAGSPAAAGATPILLAPPPPPVPPAPRPPPLILPAPAPVIPPHPGPFRIQQRSLADMANEQLRRGAKPRVDPMAQGMGDAAVDDCLHAPASEPQVGGLLAAPGLAARALAGKCAK